MLSANSCLCAASSASSRYRRAVDVLDAVLEFIARDYSGPKAEAISAFAKAFLRRSETGALGAEATYRLILDFYEFADARRDPIGVRAFNPTVAEQGYELGGAVLQVNVEDMPFLFDSISSELVAEDLHVKRVLHPVVGLSRAPDGGIVTVGHAREAAHRESFQHYELTRPLTEGEISRVEEAVFEVLVDTGRAVRDFRPMLEVVSRMTNLAQQASPRYSKQEVEEAVAFLRWLREGNFVFLGAREYEVTPSPDGPMVQAVPGSGLGILSEVGQSHLAKPTLLSDLSSELAGRFLEGPLIVITKTNREATVHRREKMDYLGLRTVGPDGETTGEIRLIGLFTAKAAMAPAFLIPILRRKLDAIVEAEDLIEDSHDHKAVIQFFDGFSKQDLFAAPTEDLRREIMGLLGSQERNKVRLFVRRDLLQRSVFILVALPRDRFNANLRKELQRLFKERFRGSSVDYHLNLGETDPAQIHFTVWVDESLVPEVPFDELEREVIQLTRSWQDQIVDHLTAMEGEAEAVRLASDWCAVFPEYYRTATAIDIAAGDIVQLARLEDRGRPFVVGVQNETHSSHGEPLTRITLYRAGGKKPLTELMPALEDMGLQVVEEVPTRLKGAGKHFIHDFGVLSPAGHTIDVEECGGRIAEVLEQIWGGVSDTDSLNELVIVAGLSARQVHILRAYRTYWRRVHSLFTDSYVNETLVKNPHVARRLVALFEERFDPARSDSDGSELRTQILADLDSVPSLDEDRILRGFLALIEATERTNAYLEKADVLSFKLRSADVPDMPGPTPMAEIFVLGHGVEGIHLRGGPVSRGGIRWSTRREDYRTEVLGLMKAQMTKNAVIVPDGAKGGFVLRHPPEEPGALREEVARQYSAFISGLLDITDNISQGQVVHPAGVRIHDGEDPYLVVAADKGTATFSDLANGLAARYGFWLGDAFASGGSAGYDHKDLGITARGAWKSLERHFRELGINPDADEFTVVGIGDMSGDVFGNGMLLSERIRLVAAFDHRHIFIDPNPETATSFTERQRLFDLAHSSWGDYDTTLLSPGGGVWARTEKRIQLAPEARKALGVEQAEFSPNDLIHAILKAPVQLLWNGGIGTYIKASSETHEAVGDRTNDALRADANDLRCAVVVEGGNLGVTQAGRIEFAERGGRINTDFIDNSAGVDCSDREVNLKILLALAIQEGQLAVEDRDELIASVSDDIVAGVLYDNFLQAQILSQETAVTSARFQEYEELMTDLEKDGILDRRLEGLPSTEEMEQRAHEGAGLTRPELSVLLSDAKRSLREALVDSVLPDDAYLLVDLERYFPSSVVARFKSLLAEHPLRKRLTATLLANEIVNSEGPTFVTRLCARTGAEKSEVVKAYRIARDVSRAAERWEAIEEIFEDVDLATWAELMRGADELVGNLTRWYLAHTPARIGLAEVIEGSSEGFRAVEQVMEVGGSDEWRARRGAYIADLVGRGVPEGAARWHAYVPVLVNAPGAIELARLYGRSPADALEVMLAIGQAVSLDRFEVIVSDFVPVDPWQQWALQTLEDDLIAIRRRLAAAVLDEAGDRAPQDAVDHFLVERAHTVARLVRFMRVFDEAPLDDLAPLIVGVRQVRTLLA